MSRARGRAALFATTLLAAPGAVAAPAAAAPEVVASVKPIHSLVAAVMDGVAAPRLLVEAGQSPHTYSLTPSDAGALERADLVVWVGPALESFLQRPVRNIAGADASLQLLRLDGLHLLRTRAGGAWAAHAHDHGDAAHGHDEHGHDDHGHDEHGHDDSEIHAHADHETGAPVQGIPDDEVDPHVWLDPDNAQAIIRAVADRLAALDPAHAGTYRDNADAAVRRIAEMDAELAERVAPVADRPFVVFHDAYHYFEDHYGLNAVGSITLSPDRQPGARRLAEIRGKIAELDARCVFREPQFAPDLVDTVVENTAAEIGTLDPLGVAQPAGPDAYFTTMRDLAETLTDCLLPES